jgi:hypothetical protein
MGTVLHVERGPDGGWHVTVIRTMRTEGHRIQCAKWKAVLYLAGADGSDSVPPPILPDHSHRHHPSSIPHH